MKATILKTIKEIESEKQARAVVPSYACRLEIIKRVKELTLQTLEQMQAAGVVRMGNTINDKYILINEQKQTRF
jgi:hypothetical protein